MFIYCDNIIEMFTFTLDLYIVIYFIKRILDIYDHTICRRKQVIIEF
jgi:hypothetical protein